MAKGNRKTHGSAFKAKVALEAIKKQQTLSELADRFEIHRNQIVQWKKQLLDRAEEIFAKEKAGDSDSGVKDLHAKIGRLTMENDFLSIEHCRSGMQAQNADHESWLDYTKKTHMESRYCNTCKKLTEFKGPLGPGRN